MKDPPFLEQQPLQSFQQDLFVEGGALVRPAGISRFVADDLEIERLTAGEVDQEFFYLGRDRNVSQAGGDQAFLFRTVQRLEFQGLEVTEQERQLIDEDVFGFIFGGAGEDKERVLFEHDLFAEFLADVLDAQGLEVMELVEDDDAGCLCFLGKAFQGREKVFEDDFGLFLLEPGDEPFEQRAGHRQLFVAALDQEAEIFAGRGQLGFFKEVVQDAVQDALDEEVEFVGDNLDVNGREFFARDGRQEISQERRFPDQFVPEDRDVLPVTVVEVGQPFAEDARDFIAPQDLLRSHR